MRISPRDVDPTPSATINLSGPTAVSETTATFTVQLNGTPGDQLFVGLAVDEASGKLAGLIGPEYVPNLDSNGAETLTWTATSLAPGTAYTAVAAISDPDVSTSGGHQPFPPVESNRVSFDTTASTSLPTGAVGLLGFGAVLTAAFLWRLRRHGDAE
jgi:hypothetical protein